MLTPHGHTFSVDVRGQKWRGTWKVEGSEVTISSAYGSALRPLGRKDPAKVAQAALAELVEAWANRQT